MATCSSILSRLQIRGFPPLISRQRNLNIPESFQYQTKRSPIQRSSSLQNSRVQCRIYCSLGIDSIGSSSSDAVILSQSLNLPGILPTLHTEVSESQIFTVFIQNLLVADIDPATAKLAISILGPFLSAFAFLFIVRIVMSWYPKLPVGRFPYVLAYAPTEPLLIPTRKLIPPLGGVDVTPVVWFGLLSFLNEILLGPQGLLVLLSQQV